MKGATFFIIILLILTSVIPFLSQNTRADDTTKIDIFDDESPVHFGKALFWQLDDIRVTESGFGYEQWESVVYNLTEYDVPCGIGFIPGANETISPAKPQNLTYSEENKQKILNFTEGKSARTFLHGWNHTTYNYDDDEGIWNVGSYEEQREMMNYANWTFRNNFGYNNTAWLGPAWSGNENTSMILEEDDMILIGGIYPDNLTEGVKEFYDWKWLDGHFFERNAGLDDEPMRTDIEYMKENFTEMMEGLEYDEPLISFGAVHPNEYNETELDRFARFTEWIYNESGYADDFIDVSDVGAYRYRYNAEHSELYKYDDDEKYILDMTDLKEQKMEILWNKSGDWEVKNAAGEHIADLSVNSPADSFYISEGMELIIELIDDDDDSTADDDTSGGSTGSTEVDDEEGFGILDLGLVALFLMVLFSSIYFVSSNRGRGGNRNRRN